MKPGMGGTFFFPALSGCLDPLQTGRLISYIVDRPAHNDVLSSPKGQCGNSKSTSQLSVYTRRTANPRRLRGGARAGRGGARPGASERQPGPRRLLFRLAAGGGRALRVCWPYGRGGNARGLVAQLFEGRRPRGVR